VSNRSRKAGLRIEFQGIVSKASAFSGILCVVEKNNEKLGQKAPLSSKSGTRVTLVFIVTEEGKIKDLGVWRGIGQGYDEYAYHLIKNNPHTWQPGKDQSENVLTRVYYELDYIKNYCHPSKKEAFHQGSWNSTN
jgi:hypothetical protein